MYRYTIYVLAHFAPVDDGHAGAVPMSTVQEVRRIAEFASSSVIVAGSTTVPDGNFAGVTSLRIIRACE